MTSIEHLRAFAKPLGVRILLENIPNELSTPEKLVEIHPDFALRRRGRVLRRGPCPHHEQTWPRRFEILKDHIRSTHVHDNPKDNDSHLWPGEGSIDWKADDGVAALGAAYTAAAAGN